MFSHDEYNALYGGAALLDRSPSRGRLLLTGADRRTYLQGLLTNDIAALSAGRGCYAALLTPQGRMISDMRVTDRGEDLLIDLPAATAEIVRQRLSDFIITEDAAVEDATAALAQIGLYGPAAARVAGAAFDADGVDVTTALATLAPDSNVTLPAGPGLTAVVSGDYGRPGFEIFLPSDGRARAMALLEAAGAVKISAETASVTRIEAGVPEFGTDMNDATIPLEAGIEHRAISFTKGCYVGQEVIIRVLHRGQGRVARRLVGLLGSAEEGALQPGMALLIGEREIGAITSAARSPRLRGPIALGYVHRDYSAPGTLLVARDATGLHEVTVAALPFIHPAGG